YRPVPVLMSLFQVAQYSPLLPRRNPHIVIPLELPDDIRDLPPLAAPPPPELVFASNPARNLFGIVRVFAERIVPALPDAKLKVFGSIAQADDPWSQWGSLLPEVPAKVRAAIEIRPSVAREQMMAEVRASRAMIYLGHKTEAFCLAVAEAQAQGVPCVVAP